MNSRATPETRALHNKPAGKLGCSIADVYERAIHELARREAMAAEGNYCCCGRSLSFHASFWSQPPPMLRLHMPMRV